MTTIEIFIVGIALGALTGACCGIITVWLIEAAHRAHQAARLRGNIVWPRTD